MESRITSKFGKDSTAAQVAAGHDLTGRTAIVTGGASGLGLETVKALAGAGATVVAAVRNPAAAKQALSKIEGPPVEIEALDLASQASVRAFAERWGNRPLNYLINNAGVMTTPFGRTADGLEGQIGANHIGHFLLTRLLTPALERGAPSRVVCLSSGAHAMSGIDFDDPNFERRPYDPLIAYGQSKTANALFALEYDHRHRASGVRAFSLMPGVIHTPLMRHMSDEQVDGLLSRFKESVKTPQQGAATTVWAALAPELEGHGGFYLEDCAQAPLAASPTDRGAVHPHARDKAAAERLWEWSEKVTGLA